MEEDISDVLFDLVSADRLALVFELSSRKQKLTALAKLLKCTIQECSRNLNRLSNSGFIKKDSDGLYEITPFGGAMLSFIPSLQFLIRERDYFQNHDLSFLPRVFVERIGELSAGWRVSHTSLVMGHIKEVVSRGKEYVWLISDQLMPRFPGIGSSYSSKELPVRMLFEQTIDREILTETKAALSFNEFGVLNEIKIAMALNENIAGVCFPGLNGKIDFNMGFSGKDPSFHSWCSDLFEHYWSKSRKIQSVLQLPS